MFLRDEKVRLFTRNNAKKMYAVLSQPDVAVVGVRFLGRGFTYDNAGYIFDENGNTYPAFHGQRIFRDTYEGLGSMPRDVAFVDAGCCMIDAKVYRILHGFDTRLSGNDAMFDFCIRARKRGYRTVVLPQCIAIDRNRPSANVENEEEQVSANNTLLEKHGAIIKKGDGFYNRNLPMGNENYILPGTESDS